METCISLLRGINVSGQRLISMDILRKIFESQGLKNVKTYVQSGNVLFQSQNPDCEFLAQNISRKIKDELGFEVRLIILDAARMAQIVRDNPFGKDPEKDRSFLHITFLFNKPELSNKEAIGNKRQEGEAIAFSDQAVYLYCPYGYGKTRLHNHFLESKLKTAATTRNWKTVHELLSLALEMSTQNQ
jgi:uncharacterized protein (DUF1697 family)